VELALTLDAQGQAETMRLQTWGEVLEETAVELVETGRDRIHLRSAAGTTVIVSSREVRDESAQWFRRDTRRWLRRADGRSIEYRNCDNLWPTR
jgi:hypothetical protein